MDDDIGDWGLLSIADILDLDLFRKNDVKSNTIISLNDLEVPLLTCEPAYAARYAQLLIQNSKSDAEHKTSNFEEIDASRSAKLRRSLAASELIREKLLSAIESFALTVQHESSNPSILRSVVLLGSVLCPNSGPFCDALIDGTENLGSTMVNSSADFSTCVDVIQSFKSMVNLSLLTKEQCKRLLCAEFSLALRCGKLSAIVTCLLQKSTEDHIEGMYFPPSLEHRVNFVKAKADSFLTRVCDLPFAVHSTKVYCHPNDEELIVCNGHRGYIFAQLGMMGTRFKAKKEFEISNERGARIVSCENDRVIVAQKTQSSMGAICYMLKKREFSSDKILASSAMVFRFDENTAAVRDVVFDVYENILNCLVCSESSRISNSKCQLVQIKLNELFTNEQIIIRLTAQQNTLKRGSGSWHSNKKCYYFTKGSTISVGRLTFKESFHPFTIEMWVFPCNASDNQSVLSLGDKSVEEICIEIEPSSEGVMWKGGSRTPHLGASFVAFTVPGKLAFCHRWWHVALIFRGSSWELWIDDSMVARASALVSPEAIVDVECCLGRNFVGCLAEVRIWNKQRTPAELSRDRGRSLTTLNTTLIGYYPLDEGEGDVIADYSFNGSHALLHNGQATWTTVGEFPIAPPEEMRCIDDFAPLAWRELSGNLFLASCPEYISIAISTDGPVVNICEYTTYDLKLVFQARVELPPGTPLKGLSYKASKHSLMCFASTPEHPKRLLIWELHQQHYLPFLKKESYESIWQCGKDLLVQCASYAKRLLGAERCLVDQLSWSVQAPKVVVDMTKGLLSSLLHLIRIVLHNHKDYDYARHLCALLHANLLCRVENQHAGLENEIGDIFPDAASLIKVAQGVIETSTPRTELLRLAFQESFFDTGLLSMTCRCLLSGKSRLAFIKSQAGRWRLTDKEDLLFRCLLVYYESLQASNMLVASAENAQLFCSSLMSEEVFQMDRWLNGHHSAAEAVKRTSHCLEVFQEILLAKAIEKPLGECSNFIASYAKLLLRTCERIMEVSAKALRKKSDLYHAGLTSCLELSAVGSLLPSFTVALPLLPTNIQASSVASLKGCREALFSLSDVLPRSERLPHELGVALTSALCRIGCSLLISSDVVTRRVEAKYLNLLWGGIRRSGSERDATIKNLQQGVGSISRVVDELYADDQRSLLICRDERLVRLERLFIAAFCSLLLPTESLRQATKQILAPMYRHVQNMRAWVLSKRQESRESLDVLEQRAFFLARFEPLCSSRAEIAPRTKVSSRDTNPQRKWRRFFQSWKALRVLKAKLPQRKEMEDNDTGSVIVQFLQDKNVEREGVDSLVAQQIQRAQYRLSGMLLLRQLIEESRVSSSLARIVLPLVAKAVTGCHYADDVQCCSKEDFLRLHGAFFQLLELVVTRQSDTKSELRSLWADVLLALLTSELRVIDFRRMRGDVAASLRSLWRFENRKNAGFPRLNGAVPDNLRGTVLSATSAAPSLVVGHSGCTLRGLGGRGTCVAPCEWSIGRKNTSYYYEVLIVDLYPRGSCSIGVGPMDYSVSRLPGWDSESYALQTEDGTLYEGTTLGRPLGCAFGIGDVIGCGWNTESKELYWTKNGKDIIVSVYVTQQQLYPLIGISGKGLIKVNFGAERFVFDKTPIPKLRRRNFGENAWDVFRVFSLRAVLGFTEWYNGSKTTTGDSLEKLRNVVEQCFECICVEIERTLSFLPDSAFFIVSLCAHLTTLGKVLVSVRGESLTPAVRGVIGTLQRGTHYVLRSQISNSRLRCAFISAWFTFMNLTSPETFVESSPLPGFLDTFLSMGRELERTVLQRQSTSSDSCTSMDSWTALAFLQRLNCDNPPHLWREQLHAWILNSLEESKNKTDTFLALRILHSGARLAVTGDTIMVQKTKHTNTSATLVEYSLEDGTCDIIENEERRYTVSLRQANITVGADAVAFPQSNNKFHEIQIDYVVRLAKREWVDGGNGNENNLISYAFQCRVLSIVWRCVRKGFLVPPTDFLPFLAKLCETGEGCTDDQQTLIQEKLVIEYCLLQRASYSVTGGLTVTTNTEKNKCVHEGESSDTREIRTRLAQELSMRGYNLDLCFLALDETSNDVHAALQLLGDHHGDFMSIRRLTTSSSSEEEDMSSDDNADLDAPEYDAVPFQAESDDGLDEYISVDQSDPLNDGIRFLGGFACVASERTLGQHFTIDFQVYLFDLSLPQVILHQRTSSGWQFLLRVQSSSLQCGWLQPDNTHTTTTTNTTTTITTTTTTTTSTTTNASNSTTSPLLCCSPLDPSDTMQWVHLTLVQSGVTLTLYKGGAVLTEIVVRPNGALLESGLCFGGYPEVNDAHLNGGLKDIRLLDVALDRDGVASLAALLNLEDLPARRAVALECGADSIRAVTSGITFPINVTIVGAVTCTETTGEDHRVGDNCQPEIDFAVHSDKEGSAFAIDPADETGSFTTVWRKRRDQRRDQLLAALPRQDRELSCYYAVAVLTRLLRAVPVLGSRLSQTQIHRLVRLTVYSNDEELQRALQETLCFLATCEEEVGDTVVNFATEELVDVLQREQKSLVFESSHPFKSTTERAHEVYFPTQRQYELHFDPRCSAGSMLVTLYADHTLSNVIAQSPGYALSSMLIHTPRFFFDVRMDTSDPQWGYRVVVLYDIAAPRAAAQLLRATLSAVAVRGLSRVPHLWTSDCLEALANAARANVGVTRRLILSCLADLFLRAPECGEPMPRIARMQDLRRMSERLLRRSAAVSHIQCRFVQVTSEFYVAMKDAEHCWRVVADDRARVQDGTYDAAADADCFLHRRQEQRSLYKRREGTRVSVEKALHPESVRIDVNANKTIYAWSERAGGAVVADIPLTAGRWYFEVRMMATGDVGIGVLPSRPRHWAEAPSTDAHITFNGKSGTFHGVKDTNVTPKRIWKGKDYVGVIMDGVQKTCSFFVNGYDTGVMFHFGPNESEAVSAAGAELRDEAKVAYYPSIVFEEEEGVTINFGGSHFEYEPPHNCFPFDPVNLTLGTRIPYNQLRAFHDLATHIVSSGHTTLPPFFHEEANPFEHSTERAGPPHVSLYSTDGVQVNVLLARNTGMRFATVRANCRVSGGRWYYEVTLRSQGLAQIGWAATGDKYPAESVGDTPVSWSVDLFRRVKWHDGKPEPLTVSRRWVVGDVIGCAIDLVEGKMGFMCNGRLLCDANLTDCTFSGLPRGLSYEPAVSIRAGNEVLFNFGSSSFKFKPEGFCALGVPDSWNERMDAFYSTLRPATTLLRLRALRDMWLTVDRRATPETLRLYQTVVDIVQQCCRRQNKNFAQLTEDTFREIFRGTAVSPQEAWTAYRVLVAFARVSQNVIPFLYLDTEHPNVSTKLLLACRSILFASLRNEIVDDVLRETNMRAEHFRLSINRMKARTQKNSWMSSIFGQTFSVVADQHPRIFRTNRRFWSVVFLGEGSEDVGGPFREHIGEMCRELMSSAVPLFVPTANHVHNTGTYRDAFVPAASATSAVEMLAFLFIGELMGGALRSNEPLGFIFPPLVWKFLCFYPILESDLDDVDRICLQCIREFRNLKSHAGSSDMFDEVFDSETFTTRLSDGTVRELCPGGAAVRVTFDRCEEYADALAAARLVEFTPQLRKMREGLLHVVPETVLCLLTPTELELRVCGKPDYAVEELREGAVYEGLMSDDRRVQLLWQALDEATAVQRRLFLRFVSGRDRMPVKLRVLPLTTTGDADSVLPRAATCFFALELPDYSSLEVMKAKLYYSIENCTDIDTDFNPRDVDEGEAPQLIVGLDDPRQEEIESATLSE